MCHERMYTCNYTVRTDNWTTWEHNATSPAGWVVCRHYDDDFSANANAHGADYSTDAPHMWPCINELMSSYYIEQIAFSALMLLVGCHEGPMVHKNLTD